MLDELTCKSTRKWETIIEESKVVNASKEMILHYANKFAKWNRYYGINIGQYVNGIAYYACKETFKVSCMQLEYSL